MKIILMALLSFVALFGAEVNESNLAASIAKCEARDGKMCFEVSYFYWNKFIDFNDDRDSEAKALIYSEKACNLRNGAGCFDMAAAYGERIGYDKSTPHDPAKRLEYLTKGCEYNSSNSCHLLGIAYSREARTKSGAERKALELKAKRFYQKACDLAPNSPCVY